MRQTIVAEITKNWPEGKAGSLLSQKFEEVIEFNCNRGYRLRDWRFSQFVSTEARLTETIIAVFEKRKGAK